MSDPEPAKRRAAAGAVEEVHDGMVVGLGSGSTAAHAIRLLGERVASGLDIVGVPTSYQAADVAREAGVPLQSLANADGIDLAIDGADQVADRDLIKGGGAAHARERIVDTAAARFLVVVDETKRVTELDLPVPIEILPAARGFVMERIRALEGEPTVRSSSEKVGPVVTDNGNIVVDCAFGPLADPGQLAEELDRIPGVIAHGLFLEMADAIYVGTESDVVVYEP